MAELKRQIAKIVPLSELKKSQYVEREGWEPNVFQTSFGEVSRINVIGIVIETQKPLAKIEEQTTFVIDDGTEKVEVRAFDTVELFEEIDVGTPILLIGKPRKYMEDVYIIPEIIRPIEKKWISYRQKEFELLKQKTPTQETVQESAPNVVEDVPEEKPQTSSVKEESQEQETIEDEPKNPGPNVQIIQAVDELDTGDGAFIEEIPQKVKLSADDVKERVNSLLLHGEIFEIKPGYLKVLK
ncbi:MAG: OB-fold nucleic acid binding domain-containing protein [Candidatus Woesearchaeota archaeon]